MIEQCKFMRRYFNNRRFSRGSVFIIVLIVVSSLTALCVGLVYRIRMDMHLAQDYALKTQAYYLARGAVERAVVLIRSQEMNEQWCQYVSNFSMDAREENLFEQILENIRFKTQDILYCIRDEQSYFNINSRFTDRFESIAGRQIAAKILDWTDADDDALGYEGAESDYYETLPEPYSAANKKISCMGELLYLKDVTFDVFTGSDRVSPEYRDVNDGGFKAIFSRARSSVGLIDMFTIAGNGKLNINTASVPVLNAVGGLDSPPASLLLDAWRTGPDHICGTEDDMCFTKTEDITLQGIDDVQRDVLTDTSKFCFKSEYFRVYAYAKTDDLISCCLMATVYVKDKKPKIIYMQRLN